MKQTKPLISLVVILLLCSIGYTQTGSKWKDASSIDGCVFKVDTLRAPDTECNSEARWDYFIIYEDGSFTSTRIHLNSSGYSPQFTNHTIDTTCSIVTQNVNAAKYSDPAYRNTYGIPSGKSIKYMYISNIYDQDEPPKAASLSDDSIQYDGLQFHVSSVEDYRGIGGSKYIIANNDIVPGDEIILAIDVAEANIPANTTITLEMDTFLNLSNFNRGFGEEGPNIWPGSISNVSVNNNKKNVQFQLPSGTALAYIPLIAHSSISASTASFNISTYGATLTEQVLSSHDPNYIELVNYCKPTDDCVKATYKVHFQNTGKAQENEISLLINFNEASYNSVENISTDGCTTGESGNINAVVNSDTAYPAYKVKLNNMVCWACKEGSSSRQSKGEVTLEVVLKQPEEGDTHVLKDITPQPGSVVFFGDNPTPLGFTSRLCNTASDQAIDCPGLQSCKCGSTGIGLFPKCILIGLVVIFLLLAYRAIKNKGDNKKEEE